MEDYNTVSRKTEEQLRRFPGGFSTHLSKPRLKFLGDMLYGDQAAGDVKLSEIARELRPGSGCSPKKKEERLFRHLAAEDLTGVVGGVVLADARRYVDEDTLVVVDPTDLQKRHARRMEGLSKVYDGSRGDVGEGARIHGRDGRGVHGGRPARGSAPPLLLVEDGEGVHERVWRRPRAAG